LTERSFGSSLWYGLVVNVNDPEQEGRVQVRIHGLYDDTANIPDAQLPWVKPTQDITSAGHNKIGNLPVGVIKGTTVGGYFLDDDKQYPIFTHVIAKAGDPQSGSTQNGQVGLVPGTNSNPITNRNKNNKFVTRKGKNIIQEDNASTNPTESKDNDGEDVTATASSNTKYATIPTVGSVNNPSGSILSQLTSVDPSHLTSVLPNAVANFIKLDDLHSFSSVNGITNIVGQTLGQALNTVGLNTFLTALSPVIIPSQLSTLAQKSLIIAIQTSGSTVTASPLVSGIINATTPLLINDLQNFLNNPTQANLEQLLSDYFNSISQQGSSATLGTNSQSILSQLGSVLPTIAGAIQSTLNNHLPVSVLNTSKITQSLQNFAMAQAYIKMPNSGKKDIAKQAVIQGINSLSPIISGLSSQAQSFVKSLGS
jgi:hypothetical protein